MNALIRICAATLLPCVAVLTTGCQTPPTVYELAEKTSINTGMFQSHLGDLSARSKALAKDRADQVVAMESFNAMLDAKLKRELYMQEQSRAVADWTEMKALMERLTALRDGLLKIEQDASFAAGDRRKALLAAQKELDTFKAALRDATGALTALAKQESRSERAKFFAAFAREVRNDMKKSLESGDETARKAKELLDSIESQFKKADPDEPSAPN